MRRRNLGRTVLTRMAVWFSFMTLAQPSDGGDAAPFDASFIRQAAALSGECKAGYLERRADLSVRHIEWQCNCTAIRSLKTWHDRYQGQGLGVSEEGFLLVDPKVQSNFHAVLQSHEPECAREAVVRFNANPMGGGAK